METLDFHTTRVDAVMDTALMTLQAEEPNFSEQRSEVGPAHSKNPDLCSRWYVKVTIGDFGLRALLDSGAARSVLSPISLQIDMACNQRVTPYEGEAIVADGRPTSVLSSVELPSEIAGTCHYLIALVLDKLDTDCMLGVDGIWAFDSTVLSGNGHMIISGAEGDRLVPLELAAIDAAEPGNLGSADLADVTDAHRQRLQKLLDRLLPPTNVPLSCTQLIEYAIDVGSARPIKQRHYPMSPKIKAEMYAKVQKMLEVRIIHRSQKE